MKSGRLTAALFALVAATILRCAGPASANPGCSLGDIGQAAADTYNGIPSGCAAQAGDPAFYPLLGFLLAAVQTPQGVAFCSDAEQAGASAAKIAADLQKFPDGSTLAPVINELNSDAGALNVVKCACETAQWKGPGELASDVSACVSDGLCFLQNAANSVFGDIFGSCGGSSPPPQPILLDCTVDPCAGGSCNYSTPIVGEPYLDCQNGDGGYRCQGSVCFSDNLVVSGYDPSDQGYYCYCPPAMQHKGFYRTPNTFIEDNNCTEYLTCSCPSGSHQLTATGPNTPPMSPGEYICLCDDSGLVVNDDGSCPPPPPVCAPTCPAGQISNISDHQSCTYSCDCPDGLTKVGDKCVMPCADASQVLLANGACCSASQATSCGTCCPDGMKPDGDSCVADKLPITVVPSKPPAQPLRKQ